MFFNIVPDKKSKGKVFVGRVNEIKTQNSKTVITAGVLKRHVDLVESDIGESDILISEDVLEFLSIPLDLKYQVIFEDGEMHIGPVIGLLLAQNDKYYTQKRLDKFLEYTLGYNEMGGLIYLFSVEGIDFDEGLAEGYFYYQDLEGKDSRWIKGVFPIPDSVFRRVSLPDDVFKKLWKCTRKNIFNSYYFNKWEFWNICSSDDEVKDNVPVTAYYRTYEDLEKMLERFGSLFMKPINGTLGNGLIKVYKNKNRITFQQKFDKEPIEFERIEKAKEYVAKLTAGNSYILQQNISILKHKGGFVDLRVNMQKDFTMRWNCTAIVACAGPENGIHSNYTNEGEYLSFDRLMKEAGLSKLDSFRKRLEIIKLCKNVCEVMDGTGENYGDFGIDIGLDENLKPWVFEANKSQFYYVPLMIGDYNAYYNARTNPVRYALALSNFKEL